MIAIRVMTIDDYEAVFELLKEISAISIRGADSREATRRYLERNPGLSFVGMAAGRIIGCIMSGHDGRRGYLQHLAVLPEYRHKGVGSALVEKCLAELERLGICKTHIDVFKTNTSAAAYWQGQGWKLRTDIDRYSIVRGTDENA